MAEPTYRWGDPPPAAVRYRRERAAERLHTATANWRRSQRAKQKAQSMDSESATPLAHLESPDRQTEGLTS